MRHRVHQVFGAGSPMPTSPGQNVSGFFQRVRSAIGWSFAIDGKSKRAHLPFVRLDRHPAGQVARRLHARLATEELTQSLLDISGWDALRHASTRPAEIERHHQARAIDRATIAQQPQTEFPMPAAQQRMALPVDLVCRLLLEKTKVEDTEMAAFGMQRQHS